MKSCYECATYGSCYVRITMGEATEDAIKRWWLGIKVKEEIYDAMASHCRRFKEADKETTANPS